MGKKKLAKRSKITPFVKTVNFNHILPTRYGFEADLKSIVPNDATTNSEAKKVAKKAVAKVFQERFNAGRNKWLFSKLRF